VSFGLRSKFMFHSENACSPAAFSFGQFSQCYIMLDFGSGAARQHFAAGG